ncbi:MAG: fibro-slime domain-containing protein [Phycisphaerae bacterium]|nr:fibro-slime domain-containing protein [Phycisphaerae bacterium]
MDRSRLLPTVAAVALAAGSLGFLPAVTTASPRPAEPETAAPEEITLTGVVRDFKEHSVAGGHVDFEATPSRGFGHYAGNIAAQLGPDNKPVFVGGGKKVTNQWKNSAGKQICYAMYNASLGDVAGAFDTVVSTGGISSSESFGAWFNDVLGTNLSKSVDITLKKQASGSYVFDSQTDPVYSALGGFFPIENQLFGNPGGSPNRNFHFTFELHTEFTYSQADNQVFSFRGDDDVWVYINGKLVVDLGGIHGAVEQQIELNRLSLVDGETYKLDFFFAERHRTQSNFKITTNLKLETVQFPNVTQAYD